MGDTVQTEKHHMYCNIVTCLRRPVDVLETRLGYASLELWYQSTATQVPSLGSAGDEKDAGGDIVEVPDGTEEVWLLPGRNTAFYSRPDPAAQQRGNLHASAAHWCALSPLMGSLQVRV